METNSLKDKALPSLPDGWRYEELGSLVEERGICYGIVQPGRDADDGVPIVRVNNIRNGRIDTADVMKVEAGIESKFQRSRLRGGEVLLTLVGTLGEVAIVPSELSGWNVARAVGVIPVLNDPGSAWVYFCLRSPFIQGSIRKWANSTVQATFNLRDVARLPILLPPGGTRQAIVAVLSPLEEKIELNRQMNATLEAMARALFQSWFVDFDLCKGKDPISSTEFRKLYPVKLLETLEGSIPEGWKTRSLDEMADYLNGLALQKYPANDGPTLPVIKIAQLRKGDTQGADRCGASIPAAYVIQDGDVLFSWSGTLEVELWCGGTGALNQHLFKVTSQEFPKWFYYLWTLHHLATFRRIAASKATTMGHIQRRHLTEAKVLIPSPKLLEAMTVIMEPLIDKIIANRIQSRTLAEVRDTLLPKLLSGEVKAPPIQATDHEH